jgi:hypothetical protein
LGYYFFGHKGEAGAPKAFRIFEELVG